MSPRDKENYTEALSHGDNMEFGKAKLQHNMGTVIGF
jgi:hypothetical protein